MLKILNIIITLYIYFIKSMRYNSVSYCLIDYQFGLYFKMETGLTDRLI